MIGIVLEVFTGYGRIMPVGNGKIVIFGECRFRFKNRNGGLDNE